MNSQGTFELLKRHDETEGAVAVGSGALLGRVNEQDVVMTPDWCAADVVRHFKPTGRILDPCRGAGAFWKQMPGAEWCELSEGRDFWTWREPMDWIISNPPYSCFRQWLLHSYEIAENIVYLIPIQKLVLGYGQVEEMREHGWVKHIRWYGTGTQLDFPYGNAIGAAHFVRGWTGETTWSWYHKSGQPRGNGVPELVTRKSPDATTRPNIALGS